MYKIIKILAIVLMIGAIVSCGKKDKEKDFSKLSDKEKIAVLDAKIRKIQRMQSCIIKEEKYFTRWKILKKLLMQKRQ